MESFNEEQRKQIEQQLLNTFQEFNNVAKSKNTPEEAAIRLVLILNKIEKELTTIEETLEKLWNVGYKTSNENLKNQTAEKLEQVKRLKLKIQQSRLNLNYHLI